MSDKRLDYISWDEYFMGVAKMAALRSKDPNTQVGACIVSRDNKILSWGIMVFRLDARTMIFHGHGRENLWTISTCILPTVN